MSDPIALAVIGSLFLASGFYVSYTSSKMRAEFLGELDKLLKRLEEILEEVDEG